jgi:hypothetical protein
MSNQIQCEPGNRDAWICCCGNRPEQDGFYPCDASGRMVEPTPEDWTSGLYVCSRCGRLIDPDTLLVVGQADSEVAGFIPETTD